MSDKVRFILAASLLLTVFPAGQIQAAQHALDANVITSDGTVYTITTENSQTVRRPYTSAGAFLSFGFNSWQNIVHASAEDMSLAVGSFVPPQDGKIICSDRGSDKGTCYVITTSKKAGFTSSNVFLGLGYSFTNASLGDVSFLTSVSNIDTAQIAHQIGALINKDGTVYLVGPSGLAGIPSWDTMLSWGYSSRDIVPANSIDRSTPVVSTVVPRMPGQILYPNDLYLAPTPTPVPSPVPVPTPAPSGNTVSVSNLSQLQSAVSSLKSNTTILIAAGTYNITGPLYIPQNISNVAIKGATGNRDDVVIKGTGMDGGASFGFWSNNVSGLSISDLTIRDINEHGIMMNDGTDNAVLSNLHLVDIGSQFIKGSVTSGKGDDNGILENSLIEYTVQAPSPCYTNGIDIHFGKNWTVRNNTFKNIKCAGALAGPAVLFWNGSADTIVTGNTFINNQRDIFLGLDENKTSEAPVSNGSLTDHARGLIANNFIYKTASIDPDVAIGVFDSPQTKVYYNTIIVSGYQNAIEYRFAGTTGADIRNNLTNAAIVSRNAATATLGNNVTNATESMFVNVAAGDLHLLSSASSAIDKGAAVSVTTDFDGQSRPVNGTSDIGADEFNN